jgi:short-subunit dehydrogenase
MLAHFAPLMVERGTGWKAAIEATLRMRPAPALATYAATKAYVLSLTESLAEELKGSGVTVTALCPGITATNMVATAQESNAALTKLPGFFIGDVSQVARDGYAACLKGEVIKVPGVMNLAGTLASRATPKWLLRKITGALGRKAMA